MRKVLILTALLGLFSCAFAFKWTFDQWPAGNQNYTFEVRSGEGDSAQVATFDVAITDTGGQFDVKTTMTVQQTGIAQSDLSGAAFGGSAIGMFAFGPMIFYGPAFMMLPMMLGEEDISVRPDPVSVMGMGKIYMDKSEQIAGHDCVVLRLEMEEDKNSNMEFALADGLPIPCYSKYGTGSDAVEVRLVKAEMSQ
jgi:hypothetical protein